MSEGVRIVNLVKELILSNKFGYALLRGVILST